MKGLNIFYPQREQGKTEQAVTLQFQNKSA
jgi:hypothetical protein